jgi:hypothetical protein
MTRAGRALRQLRFRAPLGENAGVIRALVIARHAGKKLFRLRIANPVTFSKSIRHREQQRDQRRLVFWIRPQDIEANAFRFPRFVQQPVTLGFFQRGRDCFP